jgi:probable HAF family extracellular repeat protein
MKKSLTITRTRWTPPGSLCTSRPLTTGRVPSCAIGLTAGMTCLLAAAGPGAAAVRAQTLPYAFTTIDTPAASVGDDIRAVAINASGQVIGEDFDTTQHFHGYLYSDGAYTALNVPGGQDASLAGINDAGEIVGSYLDANAARHGFTYRNGAYTTIDDPNTNFYTELTAINAVGHVVGMYEDASGTSHGFFYAGGVFSNLDFPSPIITSIGTDPHAINALDQVVGVYYTTGNNFHGFLYSGGQFATIDDPNGITGSDPLSINASGQVAGWYIGQTDTGSLSFGFEYLDGVFSDVDDPNGTLGSQPNAINDSGQVVGTYSDASGKNHGFLDRGGVLTTFDDPDGAGGTAPMAINDAGQIVGYYTDSAGHNHAFLATPAPTILSMIPSAGAVGDLVTVNGRNMNGATAVTFNGVSAKNFHVISADAVSVTVPAGATTGKISVTTAAGTGTSTTNFVVQPLQAQKLVLTPAAITPGGTTVASITLNGTALSGGAAVNLLLDGLPFTTVKVPAGQSSANYSISTPMGIPPGAYPFKATYGGASAYATLIVASPITVKSFSFTPATIRRGRTTTGTVTLSAAAPAGGEQIAIVYASFPITWVTIRSGQTSGSFLLPTATTTPAGVYDFDAMLNGTTTTASLSVSN